MSPDPKEPRPASAERVVLTGFMGSGKSTVGRELAQQLGWHFADLDGAVSAHVGLSVPEIFAQHGEQSFREAEVTVLRTLLQRPRQVIALGGGAPETLAIRDLLTADRHTFTVHLHAPAEILFARCTAQAQDPATTERPLLGSAEMAAARYHRRLPLYTAVAHHFVDVTTGSPAQIASDLVRLVTNGISIP